MPVAVAAPELVSYPVAVPDPDSDCVELSARLTPPPPPPDSMTVPL